jgi:hypothetical protein
MVLVFQKYHAKYTAINKSDLKILGYFYVLLCVYGDIRARVPRGRSGSQHRQDQDDPRTKSRPGERVIDERMKKYGGGSQAPDRAESRAQAPQKEPRHNNAEGNSTFCGPLQPVIVGVVGEDPDIHYGVVRIDGGPRAKTYTEPGMRGNHLEGRYRELPAHRQRIGRPEARPNTLPASYTNEDREQYREFEERQANSTPIGTASNPHEYDYREDLA